METHGKARIGIIGAGYIANWHAQAVARSRHGELTAVCDLSRTAAESVARAAGVEHVFDDVDALLESDVCDAVHILTPPQTHFAVTKAALEAGKHVLCEKPMTLNAADAEALVQLAQKQRLILGVNHNFLGLSGYDRLRRVIAQGQIGPIDAAEFHWRFPLTPLRSGPFGMWMLREPINLLWELMPHLFAFVNDLLGELTNIDVRLSKPIEIPGGITHYQHWQILGDAGETAVTMNLSLVEGVDDRSLYLRGATGAARLDYAQDRLEVYRANNADIVVSPFLSGMGPALQRVSDTTVNAAKQTLSLNGAQPYALGINRVAAEFSKAVLGGLAIEKRFRGERGLEVARMMEATAQVAASKLPVLQDKSDVSIALETPDTLVIGGTGFIGRALVEGLVAEGRKVRVLSRGKPGIFAHLGSKVSIFQGSLTNSDDLAAAMEGIDLVYHLAKAEEKTWDAYVKNDVEVTRAIGEAAVKADVKRLVYTGTIDSYDASEPAVTITEDTGLDPQIDRRNLYARSKAACEKLLQDMATRSGLPLVIVRPGIVIGRGGPLQHWGIGRWQGAGAVKIWGPGNNILPFVLVDDCADGLVRAGITEGIEGQSFNLIGEPMLSAKDYFDAINGRLGAAIRVGRGWIPGYYASDTVKYVLKKYAARMRDVKAPYFKDWKSRTQSARFSNEKAKTVLGWQPETDREVFLHEAIDEANLFGFGAEEMLLRVVSAPTAEPQAMETAKAS